jgi:hypothetical protein
LVKFLNGLLIQVMFPDGEFPHFRFEFLHGLVSHAS